MAAASLAKIVSLLNTELRIAEVPDYPNALNGLQLANGSGQVTRVAAAVDACLPVIQEAAARGVNLLLVHHGLFWSGLQRLDGPSFQKLKLAMDHDIAIYSAHIPLDVHPVHGNNALLAEAAGLKKTEPFFPWKGIQLGLRAEAKQDLWQLVERVETAVGGKVHVCPGGPQQVRKVGIITGGAGAEVAAAAAEGVDTFITGEGPHWSYTLAEELGVNVLYAGHYATEVFGVQSLAALVERRFKVPAGFIDHPTGL